MFGLLLCIFLTITDSYGSTQLTELIPQWSHDQGISAIEYSPDGRYVATAGGSLLLWDRRTRIVLRRFKVDNSAISAFSFSPDGNYILAGSQNGSLKQWEISTGKTIQKYTHQTEAINDLAFHPDGKYFVTAGQDGWMRLWRTNNKTTVKPLLHSDRPLKSVAISKDGRFIVTGGYAKTATLISWDDGKVVHTLTQHKGAVNTANFSPDGKFIVTTDNWGPTRIWETTSGKELKRFDDLDRAKSAIFSPKGQYIAILHKGIVHQVEVVNGKEKARYGSGSWSETLFSAAYSPDGTELTTGGSEDAQTWNVSTKQHIATLAGNTTSIHSVSFAADEKQFIISQSNGNSQKWDLTTGQVVANFFGDPAVFTPDNKYIIASGLEDGTTKLISNNNYKEIRRFVGHQAPIVRLTQSKDGSLLLTANDSQTARLWDVATGKELLQLMDKENRISANAITPNNRFLATSGYFTPTRLWDASSGKTILTFEQNEHEIEFRTLSFTLDGKYLIGGSLKGNIYLWEVSSGNLIIKNKGHSDAVNSIMMASDGQHFLTGSWDGTAKLWNLSSNQEIRTYIGHQDRIMSAVLSPSGKYVLTGSEDQTARIWNTSTGKELCRIVSLTDGNWVIVDTTGRYDSPSTGDSNALHWVVGMQAISLDQLKERYFEPGLLAKIFQHNLEPVRSVAAFSAPKLFPSVELDPPDTKQAVLPIKLKNQGGGIGKVSILVNGKEVTPDAREENFNPNIDTTELKIKLSDNPFIIPGANNRIEVKAYNAEGYLASRGVSINYDAPGKAMTDKPNLWAIIVGISDFRGSKIDLRYAAKDAEDFAKALEISSHRLFGEQQTHIRRLTTSSGNLTQYPTKTIIKEAFSEMKQAKPWDILVVYLAGHGITFKNDYYYLTKEAQSAVVTDPAVRKQFAVSSEELVTWIKQSPALKQVMILDTCAAGTASAKLLEQRNVSSDQIRAIERLKDRTGFHILMSSTADRVSYEATQFQQGLLTHALLQGMKGPALREGEFVDISALFQFTADEVPKLANHIGGIQQPRIAAPKGTSFDIGQLLESDRDIIPLTSPKPMLLQPVLQNVDELFDDLDLQPKLRRFLRESSYQAIGQPGHEISAVYIDAEQLAGGIRPSGHYKITENNVSVNIVLVRDGKKLSNFNVSGNRSDLDDLVMKIGKEIMATIQHSSI